MTVPKVLRLLAPSRFWSITMHGEMFRMAATGGRASCGSLRRAYVLNVSTTWLRLGAHCVEHERRLAAAAHARESDQPALRHVDVDVLEVVRAGASDIDGG